MNEAQHIPKMNRKILLLVFALVAVIGASLALWKTGMAESTVTAVTNNLFNAKATPTSAYTTTAVRKGTVAQTITGSGKVVTALTTDLAFSSSTAKVAAINVQVGDTVTKGQVLATLEGTDQLNLNLQRQQLAVQTAQATLDALTRNAAQNLAQAQVDQASAQKTYETAQANVHTAADSRCASSLTTEYYFQYLAAQQRVDAWEKYLNDPTTGYGHDFILENLAPLRKARDSALYNYQWCQSYTQDEIQKSQAAFQLARAKLDLSNATLQKLQANAGVDPDALAVAQATLDNAKLQLIKAQNAVNGATLTATMDGTVIKVNGKIGKTAPVGTFISVSNLAQPQIQVNMDETDLQNFAVGCSAVVTFDSYKGQSFAGKVTSVSPTLVTVQSVSMVQGLVDLQKKTTAAGKNLPLGLAANVEVSCQQADNVLIAPAQAVYESNGQYYVYVLDAQGQPVKKPVEVGLMTVGSAEIKSGLTEGERVITSTIKNP
ncbi:MAG TPA: efflux RND transporter periplasmic adaptor subunit [Anaerolineaceae bacterium]